MIENESLFRLVTLHEDELQQNADQDQVEVKTQDITDGNGKVANVNEEAGAVGTGAYDEDYDSEFEPEIEKKPKKKNRRKPIATKVNINKTPGSSSGEKRRAGPQRMFERESDIEINRRLTEYDWEADATKTTAKGITKFKCRTCNATIVTKSGLFYHMMLHTGERPYVCKYEGCGAAYPQPAGRLVHENTHTKTKKFKYEDDVDFKDQKSAKGATDVQLDLASSRTLKKLRLSQQIKNWALVDEEKAKRKLNKQLMKAAGITPESSKKLKTPKTPKKSKSKSKEMIQTPPFKYVGHNDDGKNPGQNQKVIELDTSPILNLLKTMQPNLSYNSDDQISFLIQDFDLNVKSKFELSEERDFEEEKDPLALDLPDDKEEKIPELNLNEEKVLAEKLIKKEFHHNKTEIKVEKVIANEDVLIKTEVLTEEELQTTTDKSMDIPAKILENEEKVIVNENIVIKTEVSETVEELQPSKRVKVTSEEGESMDIPTKILENEDIAIKTEVTEETEELLPHSVKVTSEEEVESMDIPTKIIENDVNEVTETEELLPPSSSVKVTSGTEDVESMDIPAAKNEEIDKTVQVNKSEMEIESELDNEIETNRSGPETYLNDSDGEDNDGNGTRHDDDDLEQCFDTSELFQEPEMPDLEIEDPDPADETPLSNSNVRKSGRKRTISVKMREKYNLSPSPPPPPIVKIKKTPKINNKSTRVRVKAKKELKLNELSIPTPVPMPSTSSSSFEMEEISNPIILKINKRRGNPNLPQDHDQKKNIFNNNQVQVKVKTKRTRTNSTNSDAEYDWTVDFIRLKNPATPTKFECKHCHKTIGKAYLRSHKYTHTGEKPYSCPYDECERRFRANEELRRHLRVHTGEKPYPCRFPKCDQSFRLFDSRKNHELLHTPGQIKPYSCSVCLKRFARKDHKVNHERMYHPSTNTTSTSSSRKESNRVKVNNTTSRINSGGPTHSNIKFSSLKSLNNNNNSAASTTTSGVSSKAKRRQYVKARQAELDWAPRVDHRLMVMNKYRTTSKRRAEKNQQRISKDLIVLPNIKEENHQNQIDNYKNTEEKELKMEPEEIPEPEEPAEPEKSVTKIIAIVFSESTDFEECDPTDDPLLINNELEVPTTTNNTNNNTTTEHY